MDAGTDMRALVVRIEAEDPHRVATFWAGLLDREVVTGEGALVPGDERQVGLRFVPATGEPRPPRDTLHLHLSSDDADHQARQVEAALRLGGRHLDVGQRPEEGHLVVADPEGNALCVIEPDNDYLAGCGPLAEVAGDGTREVGLFWSALLGWPLVWDQDEETVVQGPAGGTKVAWGGRPLLPPAGRDRMQLEVTVDDVAAVAERAVALGAVRRAADGIVGPDLVLTDPDGHAFRLRARR